MSKIVSEIEELKDVTIKMIEAQQRALEKFKQLNFPTKYMVYMEVEIRDEEDELMRTKITLDEYHKVKVETNYAQ